MSSFYGNMKNNSRASFIFDKIYPSRMAMEAALNATDDQGTRIGDGIFINRYVLVDYHYMLADTDITNDNIDDYYIEADKSVVTTSNISAYYTKSTTDGHSVYIRATTKNDSTQYYQKKVFIDRFRPEQLTSDTEIADTTNELRETDVYYAHRYVDWEQYRATYDCTVWMKIYADNAERYIMVAELDAKAPILEFINDAPSCLHGSAHFDMRASTDLNYVYFIPKNWNLILNQYDPNDPLERTETDDTYWYYQDGEEQNEFWYEKYIYTTDTTVQAGKSYYEITFEPYTIEEIVEGQSIKNLHCYLPRYEVITDKEVGTSITEDCYEYINQQYVLTTDDTIQEHKVYYRLLENQYMLAPEQVAQLGVTYYKIIQVKLKTDLEINQEISGLYELNNQGKTFNSEVEYPYFNKAGFDPKVSTHVDTIGSGIHVNQVKSTNIYPKHRFVHAGLLTATTFLPNRYYHYIGNKKQVTTGHEYNRDYAYYISEDGENYELIALFLDKERNQYQPAKALGTGQSYYYDENIDNIDFFVKADTWQPGTAYYEITTLVDQNGVRGMGHEEDTYRLDVYFPELGNTVADIYDILYGAPIVQADKHDGYNNLIGYCSQDQWDSYNLLGYCSDEQKAEYNTEGTDEFGTGLDDRFDLTPEQIDALYPEKPVIYIERNDVVGAQLPTINCYELIDGNYIQTEDEFAQAGKIYYKLKDFYPVYYLGSGHYWAANKFFDLTDEEFNALSPERYPGIYDIPVYLEEGSNVRPYNNERLKSQLAPPYDNLDNDDNISLGWSLTLLKRYLSELRYLAHGKDGEGGIGLQSDWTLEDDEAFGYIHNRPTLITTYVPTSDEVAQPNKSYYKEEVIKGEVVYTPLAEHYNRLTGDDFSNYFYQVSSNVYKEVTSDTCDDALTPALTPTGTPVHSSTILYKKSMVSVNQGSYFNYYIYNSDRNIYEKATSFDTRTYYDFSPVTVSDYSDWYYARDSFEYVEITAENYNAEETIANPKFVLEDNSYRPIQNSDYIGYYCDFDDDPTTPRGEITSENVNQIGDRQIYEYLTDTEQYIPIRYIGYYYKKDIIVYDPITNSNYDVNKLEMYKYDTNANSYTQLTAIDYANKDFYYYTIDLTYIPIKTGDNGNYSRDRQKYKKISDNNEYAPVTLEDFIGKYYLVTNETTGEISYEEITSENWNTLNVIDIYEKVAGQISIGDSVLSQNQGFIVYELPRSFISNTNSIKQSPIRCTDHSVWDSTVDYYVQDGAGNYIPAFYTEYDYYVQPLASGDYTNNSNIVWENGLTITVNSNNIITQRAYSHCVASTTQDSVSLYHNNFYDSVCKKESVNQFSIIITNEDNTSQDAADISLDVEKLRTLSRQGALDYLNNTLVNNYSVSYRIDSIRSNWPSEITQDGDTGFYYARQNVDYHNFDLDEQHFNMNKTRYFTMENVPIEAEDYEIHNIWNEVLEKVLAEP